MSDTDLIVVAVDEVAGGSIRSRRFVPFDRWTTATLMIALLVATPVLVVLGFLAVPAGEVWRHLGATVLGRYIGNSLWLMVGVAVGTTIIGVGCAWLVTMCRFPGRRTFEWALLLPLAMPAYVIAYTYTGLLEYAGPVQTELRALTGWTRRDYAFPEVRSLGGAVTMMTLVLYPYVYLMARSAFLEQSVCVLEVSRTLGCNAWQSFARVALPLARPAIVAGLALALMETLNDFGTVQYFAVDTFTTGIYRTWFGLGDPAAAAQLGAVLMLFVFALILLERWSRGRARFHHTTGRYRRLPGLRLSGLRGLLAACACLLPLAFGFLLPVGTLLAWAVEVAPEVIDLRFLGFVANSVVLAGIVAILAAALAMLLAYGLRLRPGQPTAAAVRVAAMGYAVPGSVIAVGVLLPAAWLDNSVDSWMRASFGISTGLMLTGSATALVFAYLVRFLAVAFNGVEASLAKVTPSMDAAARTLGLTAGQTMLRLHVPVIRGGLLTAALLVFVDVMKELPATMILRPFNMDTLAIRAYQLAADERLRDAAVPGLAIVVAGIVPVVLLSRAIARSRPGHHGG